MKQPQLKKLLPTYLLLHLSVFILSLSTICSKFAASQEFMSIGFIALYTGVIVALGIYALLWQQILKKIPLTNAFVNKSATLIWSLIWGISFFNEVSGFLHFFFILSYTWVVPNAIN